MEVIQLQSLPRHYTRLSAVVWCRLVEPIASVQAYSLPFLINPVSIFHSLFIYIFYVSIDHPLSVGSAAAMVRTIFPFHKPAFLPPSITFLIMPIAVLCILSVVALLCGSEARKSRWRRGEKTVRLGDNKKRVARHQSNLSSKAPLLAKRISSRHVQD